MCVCLSLCAFAIVPVDLCPSAVTLQLSLCERVCAAARELLAGGLGGGCFRCGWVSARLEPGLAIRRSSAELWELVLRGEERGGDRTGQMAALSWKGVPKPAPSKGREGGPQPPAAGLGCWREHWQECGSGVLCTLQLSLSGTFVHPLALYA